MNPKPVCVPCRRFYHIMRNGFAFVEAMPKSVDAPPGTSTPESWQPYSLWMGDLWHCKGCGALIIANFGERPIAERDNPEFEKILKSYGADEELLQVNDH